MTRNRHSTDTGLVYSTELGRMCPACNQQACHCTCRCQPPPLAGGNGIVRLLRETKGRKGKGVTLISGLPLADEALKKLAKALKQKCGSGGSVKDGIIEIQGEHRDLLEKELLARGHVVKRVGG